MSGGVRLVEAWAKRLLAADAGGGRPSHSRGQGLDFDDLRAYVPGDDVRAIDWNVTARTREPFVRQYREDSEASLSVFLERGPTMAFGAPVPKHQRAAETAATLTLLAAASGGSVGLVGGRTLPGRPHARRVAKRLLACGPLLPAKEHHGGADTSELERPTDAFRPTVHPLPEATGHDNLLRNRRRTLLWVTDFFAPLPPTLRLLSRRHRVLVLCVFAPLERRLPAGGGVVAAADPVTGRRCFLDCDSHGFREAFADAAAERTAERRLAVRRAGAKFAEASTAESTPAAVARLVRGWR